MKLSLVTISLALACSAVHAAPVTSIAGGTVLTMPEVDYYGTGPQNMAPGIIWSATKNADFGNTDGFEFNQNGNWDGTRAYTALGSSTGTIRFSFNHPVAAVGGTINHSRGFSASLVIYDSENNQIESFSPTIVSTTGAGEFHGFQVATNSIAAFELKNGLVALRDLTIAYAPLAAVPEPETYAMLMAGLGVVAGIARRRSRRPALAA